jgi:SAM-dependent methyltransferase
MNTQPSVGTSSASSVGCPGIQIEVADPTLQAYLQRYPFASGPELAMNNRGLSMVSAGMRSRMACNRADVIFLQPHETQLPAEETARAQDILDRISISAENKQVHMDDFGWEANLVPRDATNVLVLGCGDGLELIFLRAVLPQARIMAIDYYKNLLPGLEEAVSVTFRAGDVAKLLPTLERDYDLVFSNHTLEHLYEPDEVLKTLVGLLISGGHILSIMPMVGLDGTPFLEEVRRFMAKLAVDPNAAIHPLELVYFDPGHPWKTNPDDLAATLQASGFKDVKIFQRENHRSRPLQLSTEQYGRRRAWMTLLNRIFIGLPRRLAVLLFPRKVPAKLPVYFYAAERRLPFGTNYVMNLFSEEALFLARVDR